MVLDFTIAPSKIAAQNDAPKGSTGAVPLQCGTVRYTMKEFLPELIVVPLQCGTVLYARMGLLLSWETRLHSAALLYNAVRGLSSAVYRGHFLGGGQHFLTDGSLFNLSRGTISQQGLRYTQKTIHLPIFTNKKLVLFTMVPRSRNCPKK